MRTITHVRTRRALAAAVLALSAALYGACDGPSPVQPGGGRPSYADTTGVPGDTTGVPGDTVGVPPDTTHAPPDTVHVPGDTTGVPGDTTGVPVDTLQGSRRSLLVVNVVAAADSGGIARVGGAVVSVSRGGSDQVVASATTVGGHAALSLLPGRYVVRLESFPSGLSLAPGETGEREVVLSPGGAFVVRFQLKT